MNYLDVRQTAEKWQVPERRVTALCRNSRIIGVKKDGKNWLIPDNAKLPMDGRTKEATQEKAVIRSHFTTFLKIL